MDTGEINESVARKLGWIETPPSKTGYATFWTPPEKVACGKAQWDAPPYSTSIEAAWEIVEFMSQRGIGTYLFGGISKTWHCDLHTHPAGHDDPKVSESANTPMLAICLAFLKLEDK